MLKQASILKAIIGMLSTSFNYEIYSDEIVEDFEQPCFFIKLVKRRDTENLNFNSNALSVFITFFASETENKEIVYLDMTDELNLLFDAGFKVEYRYLHVKNLTADRIGEKRDILQVTFNVDYIDKSNRKDPNAGYEPIGNLVLTPKLIEKE